MPAACFASAGIFTSGATFAVSLRRQAWRSDFSPGLRCRLAATNRLRIVLNLAPYYPVLLFLLVGVGLGVALVSIGKILGPSRPNSEKNAPYECGFEAFEDARMKFDVRYYLVAILFIIFDLETAFLFPWGVALRDIGWPGFMAMIIFLLEFLLGFAYIWKKGGLDWE
jgi:NADH-quinone oxidoreductase subunit A